MPFEIVMPRLGWNMESGSLGQWLKADGETVEAGELLFTVEGDKATQEVEALESGTLYIPAGAPPPGQEVPVGTVLGYLLGPGETPPESQGAGQEALAAAQSVTPGTLPVTPTAMPPQREEQQAPAISPRARRIAHELGLDWARALQEGRLRGTGRTGRIREADVRAAVRLGAGVPTAATTPPAAASPLARRLATELGIDIAALAAQMPGRRIERADVEREAERLRSGAAAPAVASAEPPRLPLPAGALPPVSAIRRAIAERLATSAQTTAAVTLTTEADATELVRLRAQLKADGRQPVPSYTDLLIKLAAVALAEFPLLNARFEGESIVQSPEVNIGIAVDTERGLLVPVLRDAGEKTLREVALEAATLIERTRAGRVTANELRGGTFTITNLGMYDIDAFTPIINLPECAILGVGRIVPKQVVQAALDELPALADTPESAAARMVIRGMVFLSLTFDHRLVDGAPAARFLQRIKQFVEKPYLWLAG